MTLPLPPVAGVIGWPIAHSKSPLIHRFWLGKLGLDGDYSRFPVAPEDLADFVCAMPAMGLRGVNVTIPHKVAVMGMVDIVTASASGVGAANCLYFRKPGELAAANTDISGICAGIDRDRVKGNSVIILGSGGAARAAVTAATSMSAAQIVVLARSTAGAAQMLDNLGRDGLVRPLAEGLPAIDDAVLLFNATSLGMAGQPDLDLDLSALPRGCTVYDAVYTPLETGLLRAAKAQGLRAVDGLTMLIGQAGMAFELFYGHVAPRQHDAELRALLTR